MGQDDERMEAFLRMVSKPWMVTQFDEAGRGHRMPWGEGPNESMESMLGCARMQLYGQPVSTALYNEIGKEVFVVASKIHSHTRGGGSPHAIDFMLVVEYVKARRAETGETLSHIQEVFCGNGLDYGSLGYKSGMDSRNIAGEIRLWAELSQFGFTVKEVGWLAKAPDMTSIWIRHAEVGGYNLQIRQTAMSHEWASRAVFAKSGRIQINRPEISPRETQEILDLHLSNRTKRSVFMLWWVATGVVGEAERLCRNYKDVDEAMADAVAFVRLRAEGQRFHKADGSALQVGKADLWFLNGVCVPKWLVVTPDHKLDAKKVLTERNAQVRSEIVRKVGVERVCHSLGAETIEEAGEYQLLKLVIEEREARFLRMQNRSVPELYHVEGLPPHVNSLADAFRFRNQRNVLPCVIT